MVDHIGQLSTQAGGTIARKGSCGFARRGLNREVRTAARFASQLIAWFRENKRDLPWRRTRDPYAIWVSEIMLQQTQVKTVIPYWERWMRELPTVEMLARAKAERVLKLWEGLGYYSRARNLQKAAQEIVAKHSGVFPQTYEEILELPGVGRYTAGAVGSIAFGLPTAIVDGNVARVLTRYLGLGGDPKTTKTKAVLWESAGALVKAGSESGASGDVNEGLMELGATVCFPRQPACSRCPIQLKCFARVNNATAQFPEVAARRATEARVFRAVLVRKGQAIYLQQRPTEVVNGGYWELPNVEAKGEPASETVARLLNATDAPFKHLCEVKHSIMNLRITTEVFEVKGIARKGCKLFGMKDLVEIPLVSAHRKALVKAGYLNGVQSNQRKPL